MRAMNGDVQSTDFFTATGVVLQVREYYESIGGGCAPILHQDFWLRYPDGREQNLHLTGWSLPMRQGHTIGALWWRNYLVAVLNHVTGQYLNLSSQWSVMPDPPDAPSPRPVKEIRRVLHGPWQPKDLLPFVIWGLLLLGAILANSPAALASIVPGLLVPLWIVDRRQQKRVSREQLAQQQAQLARQQAQLAQQLQQLRNQIQAEVNAVIQRSLQQP